MSDANLLSTRIFLSCKEFSALTGLSLRTIAKLLVSGELRSLRVGRRRLIPRAEMHRFGARDHSTTPSASGKKVGR